MDKEKQILHLLQSVSEQDVETTEKAGEIFNQMINEDPDELATILLKIISSTDNDSFRYLSIVLFGRFFSILEESEITLSETISEFIQNSLFSLFQKENFTKQNFEYIAFDIYKCASYYKESWPQLPGLLLELINTNSIFSKSLLDCLSDCIYNDYVNIDQYFETLCNFIGEFFSSPEPYLTNLSSVLKLLYSLAKTKNYEPKEFFIPLFDAVPVFLEYSINCEDCLIILNEFLTKINFNWIVYKNSFEKYFETFIKMISDPKCESVRSTLIILLLRLLAFFKDKFKGETSIKVFDLLVENYNENSTQFLETSIYCLSDFFGEDKEFAFHIFDFLQNNSPNPVVFRSFAQSFHGIKSHFSDPNLQQSLIEILSNGIKSDDESKKEAFICFRNLINNVPINDSNFPVIELIEVISNDIQKDEAQSIEEIDLLLALINNFSKTIAQNIEEIAKMIDTLMNETDQVETQILLFKAYAGISQLKEFLPYSQNFVSKINEVLKNSKNEQFIFCIIEYLPHFKHLIDQENMNELLSLSFSFLFSEVYDEEENINYCFNEYQNIIIMFFERCFIKDLMCDSDEVIKKVIKIAIQNCSFNIEKVDKNADLTEYFGYRVIYNQEEQLYNAIRISDIEKFRYSANILYFIHERNNVLLDPFEKDLNKLIQKIFKNNNIFKKSLREYIFQINTFILPLLISKDDFLQIYSNSHQYFFEESVKSVKEFINFLKHYTRFIFKKWKDNYQQIDEIIGNILIDLYQLNRIILFSNDDISDDDDDDDEKMNIEIALVLREIFKNYSIHRSNYFDSIKKIYFVHKTKLIIQSDYIHFCVNDVTEKRDFIEKLLNEKDEKQKIEIDSLYALSVVSEPDVFDGESMCNILKSFLIDSNEFDESEKRLTVCILLQVFTNYSSMFDLSDCFWYLFDSDSYSVPEYCIEYFVLSLFSFITKFGDSIPNEKLDDFVTVIQKLIEMGLYDYLHEKMKFLLENCFTQNQ